MKGVRGEMGGDIVWKNKKPSLSFKIGWANFTVKTAERDTDLALFVKYNYGRAEGDFYYNYEKMTTWSSQQIIDDIIANCKRIAARKSDLSFTPFVMPKESKIGKNNFNTFKRKIKESIGIVGKHVINVPKSGMVAVYSAEIATMISLLGYAPLNYKEMREKLNGSKGYIKE